ncbi:MAG: putative quinol monooxygenase [Alphaproteobacteria bacterium]
MAVILEGYIRVPYEELETIKNKLNEHIEHTLNEDGCLEFDVTQDDSDECIFHVFEKFLDNDAFNLHQARTKISDWGAVSKNVERFIQQEVRRMTCKLCFATRKPLLHKAL